MKILIENSRFEQSNDENQKLTVSLESDKRIIHNNDRDIIVDSSEVYDRERLKCNNYYFYGKLSLVFKNMYFGEINYDELKLNSVPFDIFTESLSALSYNEFALLRKDVIHQVNEFYQQTESGNYSPETNYINLNNHKNITPIEAPYYNWNIALCVPHSQDEVFPMRYTISGGQYIDFNSGDGIPCRVYSEEHNYKFVCPVEHNLKLGEYVIINHPSLTLPDIDKIFPIKKIGNDVFRSEKYVFYVSKNLISFAVPNLITIKRCLDSNNIENTTSKYYVHRLKVLTGKHDYIMDKSGFETPIFEEEKKILLNSNKVVTLNSPESVLYTFKQPIDLSIVKNNLNRFPDKLYLSTVFHNGNGFFDYPHKIGFKFNYHNDYLDKHFDDDFCTKEEFIYDEWSVDDFIFKSGQPIEKGDIIYGNFVEYNKYDIIERTISVKTHKVTISPDIFNHGQQMSSMIENASSENRFGLFYDALHEIKIKEFSNYIESGVNIDNLPDNAFFDVNNKKWLWRDVYDYGFVDEENRGLDFPFLNNAHYVHKNSNIYLKNELLFTNKNDTSIFIDNPNQIINSEC